MLSEHIRNTQECLSGVPTSIERGAAMNIRAFNDLSRGWPLGRHFERQMRYALQTRRKSVQIDPALLTDADHHWMHEYGFTIHNNQIRL